MSNSSMSTRDGATSSGGAPTETLRRIVTTIRPAVQFVAFWLAVALPLLHLPLLIGGLEGSDLYTFFGLFLTNVLALLIGHNYAQ